MTAFTKVALIGMGKMGQAIDALAPSRGVEIVARITRSSATSIDQESLAGADVAIEFTEPESAVANATAALRAGCPTVLGTTGWGDRLGELRDAVERTGVPLLWSPNFSLGVQLLLRLARVAGQLVDDTDRFAPLLVETHHRAKRDAPSGTALAIADAYRSARGHDLPIESLRVGSVPGTHELLLDAEFETIRISHEARDRRVFADGALTAAQWLAHGRAAQLYSMQDLLASSGPVSER